jgi:cytochrome c oxidase cbb3-type subunit III
MKGAAALLVGLFLSAGCGSRGLPGRPSADAEPVSPGQLLDFTALYATNCAGCHGPDGRGGVSVELGDPLYLAFADDTVLRRVTANGVAGTAMPAFAISAGGMLKDAQVEALVQGMRTRWGKPSVLGGVEVPPYAAAEAGDAARGADVFGVFCASCHGPGGRGGPHGSSIVDGTYLALVSNQHLRTTVLVGRPDLGAPDFRSDVAGRPLSANDVSDVVAWLSSQRQAFPGQPYPSARASTGASK